MALLVGISANLFAHGGGLDRHGCHNDGSTGEYHCHQGPLAGQSFPSEQAAVDQGLGAGS
ncbi:YHYH domain-containing protein [Spiribacter aquaticus]|uniref:YHYH domain-containing protein n=1 Tax=Spiribacter aquaticus TaxID=1935996 RepID=A0A557RKM7_9GAMM|nr:MULTISPECIES: YHYH domain-containing protein [Spiribacter]TVO65717.1 YHYH domain-containing protein [Spiribacter aquaticus]